jgi:hypothetical protein
MFNNMIDQLKWRYACKAFDPDGQLSETQVQTLKEAFNLTASSYGLQPLKLVEMSLFILILNSLWSSVVLRKKYSLHFAIFS